MQIVHLAWDVGMGVASAAMVAPILEQKGLCLFIFYSVPDLVVVVEIE